MTIIPTTTRLLPVRWDHAALYGAMDDLEENDERICLAALEAIAHEEGYDDAECVGVARHRTAFLDDHDATEHGAGPARCAVYTFRLIDLAEPLDEDTAPEALVRMAA